MNKYLSSFLLINLILILKANQTVNEISGMNHNQINQIEINKSETVKSVIFNSIFFLFYKNKRIFQLII